MLRFLWSVLTLPLELVRGVYVLFAKFGEPWGGIVAVGMSVLSTFPQSPFYAPYGTGAVVSGYVLLPLWAFCRWVLPHFGWLFRPWWRLAPPEPEAEAETEYQPATRVAYSHGRGLVRGKMVTRLRPELQALLHGENHPHAKTP
jgi:hypothetical protein